MSLRYLFYSPTRRRIDIILIHGNMSNARHLAYFIMDLYDELDENIAGPVSEELSKLAELIFPSSLESDQVYSRHIALSQALDVRVLEKFISLIDLCMGDLYVKNKGDNWKAEKLEELEEYGLVFVYYQLGPEIAGLLAMKPVVEEYGKTAYLYEIQIAPSHQGQRWGSSLMEAFHRIASCLSSSVYQQEHSVRQLMTVAYTSLTVFSENARALQFYRLLGYKKTPQSPKNRKLRSGKVLKPSFYLFYRPVDPSDT